jgi:major type 1 subunit fimbrin (pilin)
MNLKVIISALLVAGLAAPSVFASTGTIKFTGTIGNTTCRVSGGAPGTNNPDFEVAIGAVNASDLAADGDVAGRTGYKIYIGGDDDLACPDGMKVWAAYENDANVEQQYGALKVRGGAQGVYVRLFNEKGEPIDITGDQKLIKQEIKNHKATLSYIAAYERHGNLVADKADATAVYTVHYEK